MKKTEIIMKPFSEEVTYCDSCGKQLEGDILQLSITGTGYSAYGGAVDSEWDYDLCRECATALKDYLDSHKSLKDLPKAEE